MTKKKKLRKKKMNKDDTKYIVAVNNDGTAEFFEFETRKDRNNFIKDIDKIDSNIQFAIAESHKGGF